jgi:hypothetical protein
LGACHGATIIITNANIIVFFMAMPNIYMSIKNPPTHETNGKP